MIRRHVAVGVLAAVAAAACSEPVDVSGVPRDAFMDELTGEQRTTFCAWSIQRQGGSGEHTCSWGKVPIITIAECEAASWPHCAYAMFEDCINSLSDVCDPGPTAACTAWKSCKKDHPAAGPDAGVAAVDAGS